MECQGLEISLHHHQLEEHGNRCSFGISIYINVSNEAQRRKRSIGEVVLGSCLGSMEMPDGGWFSMKPDMIQFEEQMCSKRLGKPTKLEMVFFDFWFKARFRWQLPISSKLVPNGVWSAFLKGTVLFQKLYLSQASFKNFRPKISVFERKNLCQSIHVWYLYVISFRL